MSVTLSNCAADFKLKVENDGEQLKDDRVKAFHIKIVDFVVDDFLAVLSVDELARANRFIFPSDRNRFIIVHGFLRRLLAGYLSINPIDVELVFGEHGKPSLIDLQKQSGIEFNLSHSHESALFVFTLNSPVGVDIEYVRDDFVCDDIAKRFFSKREADELLSLAHEKRGEAFFKCWTRKEAFIKAIGKGLSFPLHKFDVVVKHDDGQLLRAVRNEKYDLMKWRVSNLDVGANYVAAIAEQSHS